VKSPVCRHLNDFKHLSGPCRMTVVISGANTENRAPPYFEDTVFVDSLKWKI